MSQEQNDEYEKIAGINHVFGELSTKIVKREIKSSKDLLIMLRRSVKYFQHPEVALINSSINLKALAIKLALNLVKDWINTNRPGIALSTTNSQEFITGAHHLLSLIHDLIFTTDSSSGDITPEDQLLRFIDNDQLNGIFDESDIDFLKKIFQIKNIKPRNGRTAVPDDKIYFTVEDLLVYGGIERQVEQEVDSERKAIEYIRSRSRGSTLTLEDIYNLYLLTVDNSARTYSDENPIFRNLSVNLGMEVESDGTFSVAKVIGVRVQNMIDRLEISLAENYGNESKISQIAAKFYSDYIQLHPHIDGNGRVLQNLLHIVMQRGGITKYIDNLSADYYKLSHREKVLYALGCKLNKNQAAGLILARTWGGLAYKSLKVH